MFRTLAGYPKAFGVYTEAPSQHFFRGSASSVYTIHTCTVFLKCSVAIEVFLATLALVLVTL
jgi:hypothetical protein